MLTKGRLLAAMLGFSCAPPALAQAAPAPGPLPDWPCKQTSYNPLTAASILPHPLAVPAEQGADQQADAQARSVAAFAAAPENTPDMGIARITAFARGLAPERRPREMRLVLDEIVLRTNQLRGIIRDGIEDKVSESHLLADTVAGNDEEIAGLPADAPAGRREALEQARSRNAMALGDRGEDAERLCHRLEYTARKARRLAAAVAEQAAAEPGATTK